jgi:hypothetical protein
MKRNKMVVTMGAIVVGMTLVSFEHPTRGQVAGADQDKAVLSLDQLILRESFDDNVKDPMWEVYAEDPRSCWVSEVNQRLELRAKQEANGAFAGYLSNSWRFDPKDDFAMKVDLHYQLVTEAGGSIGFGVTPDADEPRAQHISIGIGCANRYPHYWYERTDGFLLRSSYAARLADSVTLYISYDASEDMLCLGDAGYGPENAWAAFSDVVKGEWGGKPLFVLLGGDSQHLAIGPGQVSADNLLVENGAILETSLQEVYRFWSLVSGRHFYTISKLEKEKVLVEYPYVWAYEGAVFRAYRDAAQAALRPVHRFWSDVLGGHFYTIDEAEKLKVIKEHPHVWIYEGVAFYAYPDGKQPGWASPVYRFWDASKGAHFYTIDESEKDRILDQYGDVWVYEGIAWHAVK